MERSLRITGHLFFLCYLVFALVFSYERVLFTDSAYQFFKIVNYEQFNIEYQRFPAVLTQLFTLAGVKLHLPLKWLIVCFSASFVLLYYVVYLLCVYTFRNVAAGFALVFILCLGVRHSFFHTVTETHQALAYCCLFYAWLSNQNLKSFWSEWTWLPRLITGAVIICLAGYVHPVSYLVLPFCIFYCIVDKQRLQSSAGYVMLLLIVLLAMVKYLTTPAGNYEGHFFSQIARADEVLKNFRNTESVWFFGRFFWEMYVYVSLLMAALTVHYLVSSRVGKLILAAGYFTGFLLFTLIIYNAGDARIMMERAFLPLTLIAGIPFVNDFLVKDAHFRATKQVVVILLLTLSFYGIYKTGNYFSQRLAYMEELFAYMETRNSSKMLIDWNATNHELIYVPWGFGVETLLYSTSLDPQKSKTVFVYEGIEKLEAPIKKEDLFLCVHFDVVWEDSKLNKRYFNLPRQAYVIQNDPVLRMNPIP